ncbi:MAG: hypothetical protein QNJ65_11835 [Xenococcaceae cyanobacterium MO_234.B1]|nr:hypothetical protein [Xenococcaceae cyanobacterium MO_234.B1]
MADYNSFKIPIFSGINDVSVYPSATSGGNISHFYDFYNQLIDAITSDINDIQEAISRIQTQLPPPPPVIEEFVFSNVTTSEVGGNQRATLGTIPKTGKITRITIDDINERGLDYGRLSLNSLSEGTKCIWVATSSVAGKQYPESFHVRGGLIPPQYRCPKLPNYTVMTKSYTLTSRQRCRGQFLQDRTTLCDYR